MEILNFKSKDKEKIKIFFNKIKKHKEIKNPKFTKFFLNKFKKFIEKIPNNSNLKDFYKIQKLINENFRKERDNTSAFSIFKYFNRTEYFFIKNKKDIISIASGNFLNENLFFAYYILTNPKYRKKGFGKILREEQFEYLKYKVKYIFTEIKNPFFEEHSNNGKFIFHSKISKYKLVLLPYFYSNVYNEDKFIPYFIAVRDLKNENINKIKLKTILNFIKLAYKDYSSENKENKILYDLSFNLLLKNNIKLKFIDENVLINLYNIEEIFTNPKIKRFISYVKKIKNKLEEKIK